MSTKVARMAMIRDQALINQLQGRLKQWNPNGKCPIHSGSLNCQYNEQGLLIVLHLCELTLSLIPAEVWLFSELQELNLNSNQLSSLPAEVGQLTSLQLLSLNSNPFLPPLPNLIAQGISALLAYLRTLQPIKLFYCYAHEDKDLRDRIDKHLGVLKRLGHIVGWYDREIQAGTAWQQEIQAHLNTAHIILLLISADFVNSDYCYGIEMARALELHRTGKAHVLPIILRDVDWEGAPFAHLQILPSEAKPIMQWKDQDEALKDVARGIRKVVDALRVQRG